MAEEELHRQHETLQARDKVVLKMTRDGAAEENLTQDSTERISQRPEDAVFQREEEPPVSEEAPASHKPSQQLYYSETAKMAAPQFSAPPPPASSFGAVAAQSVVTHELLPLYSMESQAVKSGGWRNGLRKHMSAWTLPEKNCRRIKSSRKSGCLTRKPASPRPAFTLKMS